VSPSAPIELLLPGRFGEAATAYGYVRTIFDQVAVGERGPTISITPSTRHVGVTRRDTFRAGFAEAVRTSREEGYPVLVRRAGGGATAGAHSIRLGDRESGMKVVGIAQRLTRRATSVGGIVLVEGEEELARVLERVYGAMRLPFRVESVGSLRRAGFGAGTEEVIKAFAAEAALRYGAARVPLDGRTLELARDDGGAHLAGP
jgi:octanoyl-[GcvH]:protein N-octanoyltransferase